MTKGRSLVELLDTFKGIRPDRQQAWYSTLLRCEQRTLEIADIFIREAVYYLQPELDKDDEVEVI